MRKKLIVIFLFLLFPFFVSAYTKEDIINLVENKQVCDQETEALYDRYFRLYSRLLKNKNVSQESIDIIYKNVTLVLKTVQEEKICSVDDLSKVSSNKKEEIYNYLYESSKLIMKSPDIGDSETTVKYNDDNSVEIYENGEYVDRVTLERTSFNYVGFDSIFISFKYILPTLLVITFILILITKKKKLLNNTLIISFAILFLLNIFYFKFGSASYDLYNTLKSMNFKEEEVTKIEVKDKKIVKYPSYESKFANLKIAELDIDLPIYYGDSKKVLQKGIGLAGSFPGFKGAAILSGHNSKLSGLKNAIVGNTIIVDTDYGKFKYLLSKIEILNSNEYSSLEENDKTLIIYTCYPFDELVYSKQRLVLYANLIEEEWK